VVIEPAPGTRLDFSGGAATAAREALRSAGAVFVPDAASAVREAAQSLSGPRAAPPATPAQG